MDISKWEPGVVSNPFSGALSDPLVLGAKPRSAKFAGQIAPLETTSNWAGSAPPKHCRTAKANHKFITKPERNEKTMSKKKRCQKELTKSPKTPVPKSNANILRVLFGKSYRAALSATKLLRHWFARFPWMEMKLFPHFATYCLVNHVALPFPKRSCLETDSARFPWMEMKLFPHFARIVW